MYTIAYFMNQITYVLMPRWGLLVPKFFGASLSEPHDNGPRARNNAIYLTMYHLPHVCRILQTLDYITLNDFSTSCPFKLCQ